MVKATTMVARGMALQCPRCGASGVLASWFKLKAECPTCALQLDRGESDYWIGAYAINLVVAEGVAALIGMIVLMAFWPDPLPASITAIAMAIALPFAFFPFSRLVWLALDLRFRPTRD
jgi:uncharacterized protein (DUF983 family)